MAKKPLVIALEEHYPRQRGQGEILAAECARRLAGRSMAKRLADLGELRLKDMDEAGIDIQVLSHSAPSLQKIDARARSSLRGASTTGSPQS